MDPGAFDAAAGVGLFWLLPTSVLFAAAALRRLGVPRWTWALYLLAVAGVLVLLHLAGSVRYPVDAEPPDPWSGWDLGQSIGLGLGRIGVAVNAVAAAAWIAFRPQGYHERLPRRETALLVATYGVMAIATGLPAVWWGTGHGVVPLAVELPIVVAGAVSLTTALVLRWRRFRVIDPDGLPSVMTAWPADAVVSLWLVGALAIGPLVAGSGLPDAALARVPGATLTATATPGPAEHDPDSPGPIAFATTTLGPDAVEAGTRAVLDDTIRWAGPLDDLASPTPARADPAVVLVEERCEADGRRWRGSVVLPSARPQDVAERVRSGWERAGYAAVDRAMGTDLFGPRVDDAPVARMRLGGGADGVHVAVESFCTTP